MGACGSGENPNCASGGTHTILKCCRVINVQRETLDSMESNTINMLPVRHVTAQKDSMIMWISKVEKTTTTRRRSIRSVVCCLAIEVQHTT